MLRANHSASDQPACERMWRHPQRQTDRDGRPEIPLQPNISEAPDVESQAAIRRGRAAEQQGQRRELRCQQEWEKNRNRKMLKHHDSAHE